MLVGDIDVMDVSIIKPARLTGALVALTLATSAPLAAQPEAQTLTAEAALATALTESPELRATLLDTLAARAATRAAADARTPIFRAGVDTSFRENFSGTAVGVVRNDNRAVGGSLGLSWVSDLGTTVSLDVTSSAQWRTVNRDPSTRLSFTIGPNYVGQALVTARQPLLRGGGRDAVLAAEREAEALEHSSMHQRDALASQLVRDVLVAYWELWYAERALAVDREAEGLAERQLREAEQRVELGTFAPTEALRFGSELARLREARRGSEATRRARALELARLLGGADPARLVPD
ncbi:MAG: TolC family protein, partial [Myxococcales bacterium]|nr:TolC family protein [Myxococcales bacterium]